MHDIHAFKLVYLGNNIGEAKCIKPLESFLKNRVCVARLERIRAFIQKYFNTLFLCSELKFRQNIQEKKIQLQTSTLNDRGN